MRKYTYDYLIVGSGLFGSTFAQIMTEMERNVWSLTNADTQEETFIQKKKMILKYIGMERIYFIRTMKKSGII